MIVLQGGLVSGVYASGTAAPLQTAILDWDADDRDEDDSRITRAVLRGRPIQAHVGLHSVEPRDFLTDSDAEAILLASQEDQ